MHRQLYRKKEKRKPHAVMKIVVVVKFSGISRYFRKEESAWRVTPVDSLVKGVVAVVVQVEN